MSDVLVEACLVVVWVLAGYAALRLQLLFECWDEFYVRYPQYSMAHDWTMMTLFVFVFGPLFVLLIWPGKVLAYGVMWLLPLPTPKQPLHEWFKGGM